MSVGGWGDSEGVSVSGRGDSEGVSDECGRHYICEIVCVCECD